MEMTRERGGEGGERNGRRRDGKHEEERVMEIQTNLLGGKE